MCCNASLKGGTVGPLLLAYAIDQLSLSPIKGHADSPVTSTPFSNAYLDIDIVKKAKDLGIIDLEIAKYLSSKDNPIDIKAAVINALSWKIEGKNNAELYLNYLSLFYHKPLQYLDVNILKPDEIFCLGYLTLMDDYFHPEKALPLLEKATERMKDSFTVSSIWALAKAQKNMDINIDQCEVWKSIDEVFKNDNLRNDLRPEATEIILDYMVLYKEDCNIKKTMLEKIRRSLIYFKMRVRGII